MNQQFQGVALCLGRIAHVVRDDVEKPVFLGVHLGKGVVAFREGQVAAVAQAKQTPQQEKQQHRNPNITRQQGRAPWCGGLSFAAAFGFRSPSFPFRT